MNLSFPTYPNYDNGSLVNLMASIQKLYGMSSQYAPLALFPENEFKETTNIVFLLLDGLGFNYLQKYGKNTVLMDNLRGKITSVFPSTTAAAVTSIFTGVAPLNHAVLAWFIFLKELGVVSTILPMHTRAFKNSLVNKDIRPQSIFQVTPLFPKFPVKTYVLSPKGLQNTPYNQSIMGAVQQIGYEKFADLSAFVQNICKSGNEKKFIMAYWPKLDEIGHETGIHSEKALTEFNALISNVQSLVESLQKLPAKTKIIAIADHGQLDTPPSHNINLESHPALSECLTLPICGEGRAAFCYVRPTKAEKFEQYVKSQLTDVCIMKTAAEMVKEGIFGQFSPHSRFFDRVGDYILLMKEDYIIKDTLLGEKRRDLIGNHGGVHEDEIYVPFVVI
jgi:hypothetical protein